MRLARVAAAGFAVAAATALPSAVSAQSPPLRAHAVFSTPGQGEVVTTSRPRVAAHVFLGATAEAPNQKVHVVVSGTANATVDVDAAAACQSIDVPVALNQNGRYEVSITTDLPTPPPAGAEERCQGGMDSPRDFFVAAPPAPPVGVRATSDASRAVTIAWSRNREPDMVGYRIQRARGGGAFEPLAETPDTSFKDASAQGGRDLRYRVLAVRRGKASPEVVVSDPSAPVTVGAGAGAGGASAGRGGGGSSLSRLDFAKFSQFLDRSKQAGPVVGDDGGFEEGLPYQEAGAEELGADEEKESRRNTLAFVAGGLLTLVTFFFLRCLRAEVNRQPLLN